MHFTPESTSSYKSDMTPPFTSSVFSVEPLELAGTREWIVRGGRHLLPDIARALRGIERIGIIGWGPQGAAQARNLRDSLAGSDIEITVGLRPGSPSAAEAEALGFRVGGVLDVVAESDLVLLLVSDAAQVELHQQVFDAMKPGATLGLSHGFLLGHLEMTGGAFPGDRNVIAVCPKGMGRSVRRLYVDGSGINASVAVHQDVDGRATDLALAWAIGIGAPWVFWTTLQSEYLSDIVGERAILLGAVHGIVEALYRRFTELGDDAARAFVKSTESLSGPLARTISSSGIDGVAAALSGDDRRVFEEAFCATYGPAKALTTELYDEVASGNEIRSVLMASARLDETPMPEIDGARMWAVGANVRTTRDYRDVTLEPLTAGIFCGAMVAQVDVLRAAGHPWSEIANESVIEVVDSLIPYMHARGIAHMVDSCSTTARLGARRWGPRFEAMVTQAVLPVLDADGARDEALLAHLRDHDIHGVLATARELRPPVDIVAA